ncbi:hypothetical protein Q3A66_07860 [Hymenobacter sp. BT770]|uniref:hypothetical protein n=1 Tax=Hymenobacter sp. BT770 TaxID=2886942 RepID=UPI001D0F8BCD|nr:hypothetical protein [Hymenobacter sp. BT770]MCC3152907.1 hypothetical protein [Hymenobacter sp. BT770]MDO3414982.1 hypothetical protein [Hymenobacter sp. BT770]
MKTSFNAPATATSRSLAPAQALRPALLGLLALAGTGIAGPALAQGTQPVTVTQPDGESLRVRFYNSTKKPAVLGVVQLENGRWILRETHKEPAYGTLLKFNNLPSGKYAVLLRVGRDRYRYNVQVDTKAPGTTTIAVRESTSHRVENGLATASL